MADTFTKRTHPRPAEWEVAGLNWLAEKADAGGAEIVWVVSLDERGLTEEAVAETSPSRDAAFDFGRRLAVTHELEGGEWGAGPAGWTGSGFQGPNEHLLELSLQPHDTWGSMYADERIRPLVKQASMPADERAVFERLCERLREGHFDTGDDPARLHGDLWAGNLLWSPSGCVLIDPSAQVGHRETDLAALALFGCPFLADIIDGYQDTCPLSEGWEERIALHQLSMVLMHAVVFGGGYRAQAVGIARRYAS